MKHKSSKAYYEVSTAPGTCLGAMKVTFPNGFSHVVPTLAAARIACSCFNCKGYEPMLALRAAEVMTAQVVQ